MNPRTRLFWGLGLLLLCAAPAARAQFDAFKKLKEGLGQLEQTASKVADKAKEAGKLAKGVAGIGPEEERVIGGSVAHEIVGAWGGVVRDEIITLRVNLIGKSLARYGTRPEIEWRFGVLATNDVNAFSSPGGTVFITRGLYSLLTTDDALAAVLAHEIAHINRRHALKIVERTEFIAGATELAAKRSSDVRAVEAKLRQFDLGISQITKTLFEKGFDPATEYEADKDGRALAALTGYAPGGLRATLVQLQQRKTETAKTFSSHPPLAERVKRLPNEPPPVTP